MARADPWEQRADEPANAFTAFTAYLFCGPERSVDAAYRRDTKESPHPRRKVGARAPGFWRAWAKAHDWQERARAWDNRTVKIAQAAREQVIAKHAASDQQRQERQRQREDELLTITFKALRKTARGLVKNVDLDLGKFATAMKAFCQMGRINAQMPIVVSETASSAAEDLFVDSPGQMADILPDGAMPPMPDNPAVKPEIGVTIGKNKKGMLQPKDPVRPGPEDLQQPRRPR